MDERRRFPRFKVGVEVHWKKIASADERTALHISHVKDLSTGGVCLVLHSGIHSGDLLELVIQLPDKVTLNTRGRVVWMDYQAHVPGRSSSTCEGGIEFLDLSDEMKKEILLFTSRPESRKSGK